jgi:hypothetical protein
MMLLLLSIACRDGAPPLADASKVWLESSKVEAGAAVRLHTPPGVELPAVTGVTATQAGTSPDGLVWELRGEPGSYLMDVPNGAGGTIGVVFDIGVDGPSGGPMADIAALPPPEPPKWPYYVVAAVAFGAGLAGVTWLIARFRPKPPPPPPEPPDRIARREWAALRSRTDLPSDQLAAELSAVFRRYLQAVHSWPATSRTSREILDALAGDLPALQLDRARRLLNAMDIVRFSDRSTHDGFFAALDEDFEALLSTRLRKPDA